MTDSVSTARHLRKALLLASVVAVTASVWIMVLDSGPGFSDDPRARKVAFAQWNGDMLIMYHRCGEKDLIPYVDAAEVTRDDQREWEVEADHWSTEEASWLALHPVTEEELAREPDGSPPRVGDAKINVHIYSASIENRWHLRVQKLEIAELPVAGTGSMEVLTADGEVLERDEWTLRAQKTCGIPRILSLNEE